MTRLLIIGLLAAAVAAGQEIPGHAETSKVKPAQLKPISAAPPKPSDPITDRLRFEIAVAQRDYVIAKNQYDAAMERLRAKTSEAEALCQAAGKKFSPDSFACAEAPKKVPEAKK
jgi:hypothetical protein